MFTNLLFLILVLLLVNLQPEVNPSQLFSSSELALTIGLALYGFLLVMIFIQNMLLTRFFAKHQGFLLIVVNLELLFFLSIFQFLFGSLQIFSEIRLIKNFELIPALFSILLYLVGIAWFHFTFKLFEGKRTYDINRALDHTLIQFRMMVPFVIPFLIFTFIFDLISLYPHQTLLQNHSSLLGYTLLFGLSCLLMLLIMIFFPYFIQKIWQCRPLQDSKLKIDLTRLCEKAKFHHAGLMTWTVMNDSLTAAIIGLVPRFRYVMFTQKLLREFSTNSIKAILAHEIGHSYHKHLWIYPFIIFGMVFCTSILTYYVSDPIASLLSAFNKQSASVLWDLMNPLLLFICYALIIAIYFRLVFGFFSRLFERQADLHVYHLKLDPEDMIEALDRVGVATGYTHDVPSWHHYSIRQRIDFLKMTMQHPEFIGRHHRKVKWALGAYFLLLALGLYYSIHLTM